MSKQWYVYILLRPNNKPFYVGKGKGKRVDKHEAEARTDCACHKCRTIRKIWRSGGAVKKMIIITTEIEREAFEAEAIIIEHYGIENLTNVQIGQTGLLNRSDAIKRQRNGLPTLPVQGETPFTGESFRDAIANVLFRRLMTMHHQRRYWYQLGLTAEQAAELDDMIELYRDVLQPIVLSDYWK